MSDWGAAPAGERNLLRRVFCDPALQARWTDWESDARFALAAFRVDAARAGDCPEAAALAAELQATNADFRRLWAENDVRGRWGGVKHLPHPIAGPISLEYSTFAVDGANGLSMVVFTPMSAADVRAVESLLADRSRAA